MTNTNVKPKPNMDFEWTDQAEEVLVQNVELHQILWDKSHNQYRRTDICSKIWADIAKYIGCTAKQVEHQFTLIKRRYVRYLESKNLRSGSAAPKRVRSEMPLAETLQFLDRTLKRRKTFDSIPKIPIPDDDIITQNSGSVNTNEHLLESSTSFNFTNTANKKGVVLGSAPSTTASAAIHDTDFESVQRTAPSTSSQTRNSNVNRGNKSFTAAQHAVSKRLDRSKVNTSGEHTRLTSHTTPLVSPTYEPRAPNTLDDDPVETFTPSRPIETQRRAQQASRVRANGEQFRISSLEAIEKAANIAAATLESLAEPGPSPSRNQSDICKATVAFMTTCMVNLTEEEELEMSAAMATTYAAILDRRSRTTIGTPPTFRSTGNRQQTSSELP